ncbi:hypothetical protein [Fusibacter sp. 3D3]|uniref:hypothetical protein n=1 Tax=Fusibacter sp. 3D3 TaxID=1048380 RepID=UPI00085373FF|nr:hypothetical protein [Fusibacter sp. 3D3]GAU76459.1 hypothetical protein F3D3_1056 [Fusibacter sp. 3D3]
MKFINRLSTVLSIIMLCLIAGNILLLSDIKTAIQTGSAIQEWMSFTVAIFLIIIGLSHLFAILNSVKLFLHFRNDSLLRSATFVICFFSLFLLAVDVMMLSDIGHEYIAGYDTTDEWRIVFAGHAVHVVFALLLLFQCIAANRLISKNSELTTAVKDEALFLTVTQIGIVSAILGLICLFLLSGAGLPQKHLGGLYFLLCIVFILPYGLATGYWFFTKRKEYPADWYDEKQFADISLGAFVTLLSTIFIALVIYCLLTFRIIDINTSLWFPEYFMLSLLLFSGSTLYLSKRV